MALPQLQGTSDACETTTTPQLRSLQRGAVRHHGAGRPLQARAQIATSSTPPSQSTPAPNGGAIPPNRWTREQPHPGLQARRHRRRRPTQPPGSLAVALACRATSIRSTPTRTARSPAPSSTKRSSSATGPTRIAAFAACARQAGVARSTKGVSMNILSAARNAAADLPGDRFRRRTDAAAFRTASASAPGRARQPACSSRALDRGADPRSLRHGRYRQQRRTHPSGSAAPGGHAAQLRRHGPEQGRRADTLPNMKRRSRTRSRQPAASPAADATPGQGLN